MLFKKNITLLFIAFSLCVCEPGSIQACNSKSIKDIFSRVVYFLASPESKEKLLSLNELYKRELDLGARTRRLLILEEQYKNAFIDSVMLSTLQLRIFAEWSCFAYIVNKDLFSKTVYFGIPPRRTLRRNFINAALPCISYGGLSLTNWPLFQYPRTILAMQALAFLWASKSQFVMIAKDPITSYYKNKDQQLKEDVDFSQRDQVTEQNQVATLKYVKNMMSAVANPMVSESDKTGFKNHIVDIISYNSLFMFKDPDLFYKWSKTLPNRYIKAVSLESRKKIKNQLRSFSHCRKIEYKEGASKYPFPIEIAGRIASFFA